MNLERMQALRDVAQDVLDRRSYDLGFGEWDCGTYACLWGHFKRVHPAIGYATDRYFEIDENMAHELFRAMPEYGDWKPKETGNEPGDAAYAELERRIEIIDWLIAEELAKQPVELPKAA